MKNKRKTSQLETVNRKNFSGALMHFFKKNIPALAGDIICEPVVKEIIKMADKYLPSTEHLRPGQVLWYAVDSEERCGYGKRIEDCKVVPVMVDLITDDDIKDYIQKVPKRERQRKVIVRLHNQAYEQGGVFSYADTAAIMRLSPGTIGKYVREYEKETGNSVPRRGNIHDIGPTLTHKRSICIKHLAEGKSVEETALETRHSPSAVVRYTNDFKRVYTCLKEKWDMQKIQQATGLSGRLVKEYIDLIENKDIVNDDDLPF